MVAHHLVDGGLTNICIMYQYNWMIYQTTWHTTIHIHYHMSILIIFMWIKFTKICKDWVVRSISNAINIEYPLIASTMRTKKCECKKEVLRCCKISCIAFMCERWFQNIDTDLPTFFQSSDHDKSSSNNENEASDEYSDSNSNDELFDPYLSDDNDLQMNEGCNHTNNAILCGQTHSQFDKHRLPLIALTTCTKNINAEKWISPMLQNFM